MKIAKSTIILRAVLVLFGFYCLTGIGPAFSETNPQDGIDISSKLQQKILSFTMDGRSAKGVKQWRLEGNSAEVINEAIHLKDLVAVAYGDNVTINLTSDEGVYHKDKGVVELVGNVKVVSDNGTTLTTDKAFWSQETKEISTESFVRIESAEMIATGTGGMANSDEKIAMLKKDVTVKMEPKTEVKCVGSLEVSQAENRAVFHDKVEVTDKDGNLFADKLTVEFDPDSKKIKRVIAEGNVKVAKGNSYTLSDKAEYTEGTKSAKLTGSPRIIIDSEEVNQLDGFSMGDIVDKKE